MNSTSPSLLYYVLFISSLITGSLDLSAQNWQGKMIHITITDEKENPLEGASIIAKGDMVMALADSNGIFSQKVHESVNTLLISCSGYQTQQIDIREQSEWLITLSRKGWWYTLFHPRMWRKKPYAN